MGGAGRREMLAAAQRCREAVRRNRGHRVGDRHVALLQLEEKQTSINGQIHTLMAALLQNAGAIPPPETRGSTSHPRTF